jgi:hypothetical protein
MAENPGSIVEIRAGTSQRPLLELRPGQVVQPMSIGRVGMWPVEAPGVLDIHAYVYFDGNALFIQSADAGNPAKGNGQAIGTTWQQIEIPCTIELGRARLVYRTLDEMEDSDEDKTVAQAIQLPVGPSRGAPQAPAFTPNAGAFSNRNKGPDSDATRLQPVGAGGREPDPTIVSPLEMAGTPMGGVPKARPAAGMPAFSTDIMPQSSPTAIGAPPAPPPPQNMGYAAFGSVQVAVPGVPPPPPNPMMQTLNAPMQSQMQQPMMQMQQPMMQQQPGMMMQQPGTVPQMMPQNMMPPGMPNAETGRIVPPGELTGFARAKAEWQAMPPIRKVIVGTFPGVLLLVYFMLFDDEPQQQARKPRPQGSTSASVSSSAPPPPVVDAGAPVVTNPPPVFDAGPVASNPAPPPTNPLPPPPKGKVTLERQAFDLVGQGQFTKAADIYDQLATQTTNAQQAATFREASRVLRSR